MRTKDFVSLAKRLLPELPGFVANGPMIFIRPVGHILRGFYFEGSSFDSKSFYVWMFILPLCVPAEHISFSLGKRIRGAGGERWHIDAPDVVPELKDLLKREAVSNLSRIGSLRDFVDAASRWGSSDDPQTQEALAYVLARASKGGDAVLAIDQLLRSLHTNIPWQVEMTERAKTLKTKIQEDPAEAQRQLETWERQTAKNLGIEEFV